MEVIKLDKNNCNLIGRIVDAFLKNEKAVIYLGDNEYVTYHSYQARRNNTKYRDVDGNLHFACTLNASGLATSRLVPAIVEQYQNADGSITVPEVLRPYLNNLEVIR